MGVSLVKNMTEEEHDLLEVWWEHVRQSQREQETLRALARASVRAYVGFVDSLFSYYRNVRAGEEVKDVD
jgi:hypothetical protein